MTFTGSLRLLRVFFVQVAELFNERGELLAGLGEPIFYAEDATGMFRARNESVIQQLAEALIQHLGGYAGNKAFQLARTGHVAPNGREHRRRPFATHDVFQPPIRSALAQ